MGYMRACTSITNFVHNEQTYMSHIVSLSLHAWHGRRLERDLIKEAAQRSLGNLLDHLVERPGQLSNCGVVQGQWQY